MPLSALVVGSMSPDFIHFLRLTPAPEGHFSHTLPGVPVFCLPLSLLLLWCFHTLLKWPLLSLMPPWLQRRLAEPAARFTFRPVSRFALVVVAIVAGALTHLFWDGFTHGSGWAAELLPVLRTPALRLGSRTVEWYELLQYLGTFAGGGLLLYWAVAWLRAAPERDVESRLERSSAARVAWAAVLLVGSAALAALNGWWRMEQGGRSRDLVIGAVIAGLSGLFVLLVGFGILWHLRRAIDRAPPPGQLARDPTSPA